MEKYNLGSLTYIQINDEYRFEFLFLSIGCMVLDIICMLAYFDYYFLLIWIFV